VATISGAGAFFRSLFLLVPLSRFAAVIPSGLYRLQQKRGDWHLLWKGAALAVPLVPPDQMHGAPERRALAWFEGNLLLRFFRSLFSRAAESP